jgi:hypothetical protein
VSPHNAGIINAADMLLKPDAGYGQRVSSKSHRDLFERISVGVSNAVAQVPLRGSTGGVHSCTFRAIFGSSAAATSVWAVWW